MRFILIALSLSAAATQADAARILFAGGNWAAIDFGVRCEARSKALWAKRNTEPFAGFAFDRAGARQGQFYVHLGRPARTGAAVMATIGTEPFLLGANGQWAWSRSPDQQAGLLDAARYGTGMRIEYRDSSGRRTVEHYALAGAATAIDSAAAACAGIKGGS
ncbi:hypothetical protein LZ519_10590 [Sphingomonas sp. RG327]|jgi:hypothetical protein|uniref:Uncharacterized protein n=1 Tax=Sphingomonas anseongensis TaxID=2908207 RepID=A0ABT0RHM2_9SPHN|nr:hypothetical protein [Sphingomonas anseongensis]MCL6679756.1 hypothetical protein [Sphingomonas anseongensis]